MPDTAWTEADKLAALMRLPWTVTVREDPDDQGLVARVAEVPDAIATGGNLRELGADLWASLSASLLVRLEHGDPIPLPKTQRAPWENTAPPTPQPRIELRHLRQAWVTTGASRMVAV